jgi:hypothetical protein
MGVGNEGIRRTDKELKPIPVLDRIMQLFGDLISNIQLTKILFVNPAIYANGVSRTATRKQKEQHEPLNRSLRLLLTSS